MANPFSITPANPLQALMLGTEAYDTSRKRTKEAEQEQAFRDIAPLAAAGGLNNKDVLARLLGMGPAGVPTLKAIAELEQSRASANSVYGTPIYGTVDGKTAIGTFDKNGKFRPIDTGGFQPTPGTKTIDTATGTYVIDAKSGLPVGGSPPPRTPLIQGNISDQPPGAPIPVNPGQPQPGSTEPIQPKRVQSQVYYPKDLRGAEREKGLGKNEAEASAALPQAIADAETIAENIKTLVSHPGKTNSTGAILGRVPPVGGDQADFIERLNQVRSQGFSLAVQRMRGLGALSNVEGQTILEGVARLGRIKNEKDLDIALNDINRLFQKGIQVLRERAGPAAPAGGGGGSSNVVPWDTYFR